MGAKKPFKAQQDMINDEAKKRAEKIDRVAAQFFQVLKDEDMSINDLRVITNQITQQVENIFLSNKITRFLED